MASGGKSGFGSFACATGTFRKGRSRGAIKTLRRSISVEARFKDDLLSDVGLRLCTKPDVTSTAVTAVQRKVEMRMMYFC